MADVLTWPTQDGQEFQQGDMQTLSTVAGLADDRTLAEILRLAPYDGTNLYKTVLPYGVDFTATGIGGGFYPGATNGPNNPGHPTLPSDAGGNYYFCLG